MLSRFLIAFTMTLACIGIRSQVPTGIGATESMPKQVWASLDGARRAAARNDRSLVILVPEDETRYRAAWAFFGTLEGVKARLDAEVWLAGPGDPVAKALLEELALPNLPVMAWLTPSGKGVRKAFQAQECVPMGAAFSRLFESKPVPVRWLQDWVGPSLSVDPFLAFAADRKKDLAAGAREPHRTWLMSLLKNRDDRMKNWAATRLVEADAPIQEKEPAPFPVLIDWLKAHFKDEVLKGNRKRAFSSSDRTKDPVFSRDPNPPLADLGDTGVVHKKSPFWPWIRDNLRHSPNLQMSLALYAILAPELIEADRGWILVHLTRQAKAGRSEEASTSALYWIATDWLLLYGKPQEWEAFMGPMALAGWDEELVRLRDQLKRIPGYWAAPPGLQSMFCEGETLESFWEHPDACLASWGVTREALVEFGMDRMVVKDIPRAPAYPKPALALRVTTTLQIRMLVGADGEVKWVRPEPGYGLGMFAPTGLEYAMRFRFDPVRIGNIARPSQFLLAMPFALR